MTRRAAALALACYSIFAGLVVIVRLPPGLAAVCVVPLVLFAPGYAIVLALGIPARSEFPGRIAVLAVALSMAATALGGLVINALAPLTSASWAVGLGVFTFACAMTAYLRSPQPSPPGTSVWRAGLRPWMRPSAKSLAITGSVLAMLAGAITLTEINSRNAFNQPLTVMTLVSETTSTDGGLRLSVTNLSTHTERLVLSIGRKPGITTRTSLTLAASHSWAQLERPGAYGLHATLTRVGERTSFTGVSWIPPRLPSPSAPARRAPRRARGRSRAARGSRSAASTRSKGTG